MPCTSLSIPILLDLSREGEGYSLEGDQYQPVGISDTLPSLEGLFSWTPGITFNPTIDGFDPSTNQSFYNLDPWSSVVSALGQLTMPDLPPLAVGTPPEFSGLEVIIPTVDRSGRPTPPTELPPTFIYPSVPTSPGDPPEILIGAPPANETVRPVFNFNRPEPTFSAERPTLNFPAMPGYDIVRPNFVYPSDPNPIDLSALPSPPVMAVPVVPEDFTYLIPETPTLSTVTLPTRPEITFPTFDYTFTGTLGDYDGEELAWSETPYGSELLTNITNRLNYFLTTTSTGLSDEFWDALWARAVDKEMLTTNRARIQVTREFSARGFVMPTGFLAARRDFVAQEGRQRVGEVNRENTLNRIKVELENLWKAIAEGTRLEQILIDHFDKVQDRALRAAMAMVEIGIKIYEAQIRKYEVDAQVFEIRAKVYDVIIRSLVSQIEVYKAELEAARLTVELDKARVETYTAQIQGLQVLSSVYKNRLDAARFTLEQNAQDITMYGEQLKGYDSYIRAQAADYQRFQIMLQGLETRAKVYETDISTYRTRVEATKAIYDGQAVQMQVYQTDIEAYKARVQAFAELLKTESIKADVYRADVEAYTAEVNAFKVTVDAEIARLQVYSEQMKQYKIEAEVFGALLDAEKIKQDVYKVRMESYGISAQAYKADVDAQVAEIEATIKRGQLDVEIFKEEVNAYSTIVQAQSQWVSANGNFRQGAAATANARTEQYKAWFDARNTQDRTKVELTRINAEVDIKGKDLEISVAQLQLQSAIEDAKIASSILLGKAQVYSHLAAAKLAQYNVSRSESKSVSESTSLAHSQSVSDSTSCADSFSSVSEV
jgi:hypothetical protein